MLVELRTHTARRHFEAALTEQRRQFEGIEAAMNEQRRQIEDMLRDQETVRDTVIRIDIEGKLASARQQLADTPHLLFLGQDMNEPRRQELRRTIQNLENELSSMGREGN